MARKHGIKRGIGDDDKKLKRKEAKHLKDFGEEHPINDKIRLEDRCAKRVYENNDDEDKNEKKNDNDVNLSSDIVDKSDLQPDYYEQLLDVFGKKKDLQTSKQTVNQQYEFPNVGSFVESRSNLKCFDFIQIGHPPTSLDEIQVKPSLRENIPKTMMKLTKTKHQTLTPFQLELLSLLTTYKNLFYPERTMDNGEQIRMVYSLHALNHILRT
ncbi:hypothetical protein BLA29_006153, partial [Euroglyphus maynei]